MPKCIREVGDEAVCVCVCSNRREKAQRGPMLPTPSARAQMHLKSVLKCIREVGDKAVRASPNRRVNTPDMAPHSRTRVRGRKCI